MVNLSICVPSIRPEKIGNLYYSIVENFHRDFELIVCGPVKPLFKADNLIFIEDFGSPARCCNIAASQATGKYITFIADDATYLNKSISRAIIKLEKWEEEHGNSYQHIIVVKYVEGNMEWWRMTLGSYLEGATLNSAYPQCISVGRDWLHFNTIYLYREYFIEMGGYDSVTFETPHFAAADLSVRCHRNMCTTQLMDEATYVVTHSPGETNRHGPIHFAHHSDHEKYINLHNNYNCINRILLNFDSWIDSPEKWVRR